MSDLTDAKERREALDPTRSFIIQAPAGSGKTELLIRRFLKLLSGVAYPEQILCMTFTRKAAGEMRSRIMAALKNAAENPPPPEIQLRETWDLAQAALQQDRLRNWRILTYHSRLKVQTIDSFCAWLVRHLPLTSRMGGALDPQENAGGSYREAIRRLLAKVEEESPLGQNVRAVMEHLDNDKSAFETRILQLLEKRSQWFLPFFRDTQISAGEKDWLQRNLQTVVESRLENTNDLIPDSIKRELPPLAAWAAGNLQNDKPGELISLLHLSEFPEPKIQNLLQWQDLTKLLLTDKGEFRKTVTKSLGFPTESDHPGANQKKRALLDIIESFSGNNTLRAFLNEVRLLPGESFSEEYWEVLKTSMELLQPLAKTLRQVFKEQEKTDFTEISLAALRALGEFDEENKLIPTDLMLSLDYQIQHILVDEYQDTSFKQFDMLYRLTAGWTEGDGRTLFIVGDPMQSIFRFRDAEVGLFLKTQNDGVGDVRLKKLTLKSNFRSQKKIVDWINGCFQDTFPKAQDIDRGAVPYAPSRAVLPPEASEGVVLHPRAGATAEVEAGQIADLITRLQKEWPDKTVAILVRARAHLKEILKEFRARGLAFQAEDIDPLTERWEILDLLALMRALRSPLDRVSWLSILRAPWCGLTLADLHRLCLNGGTTPVWSLLQDRKRLSELSPDGRERLQRFMDVLTPALAAFPGVSFRGLLEGVWIRLGGPACVPASSLPDIEVFFEEVGRVAESGALSRLDRFEQELERLYSSPSPKTAAVQVMTMHKAKGLEFDFVLIPGLGWRKRAEQNRLVFWILHGDSLLLAPIHATGDDASPLYKFLKRLNETKDDFESQRLLYVAATRAKTQLHLFGHAKAAKGEFKPESGSLLAHLWPHLQGPWNDQLDPAAVPPSADTAEAYPPVLRRLPGGFTFPEAPAPLLPGKTTLTAPAASTPIYEWAGFQARCVGSVLHRCFQHLADQIEPDRANNSMEHWRPRLNTALAAMGLSGRDREDALDKSLRALENILADPQGRWVLSRHQEAMSEYSLTRQENGKIVTRIIDRTFVDEGVRWIIDYKTSEHGGGDLDQFFENEKKRYQGQLDNYAKVLQLMGENRPFRKALYNPLYRKFLEL